MALSMCDGNFVDGTACKVCFACEMKLDSIIKMTGLVRPCPSVLSIKAYDAVVKERDEYRAALAEIMVLSPTHDWPSDDDLHYAKAIAREVLAKYGGEK